MKIKGGNGKKQKNAVHVYKQRFPKPTAIIKLDLNMSSSKLRCTQI